MERRHLIATIKEIRYKLNTCKKGITKTVLKNIFLQKLKKLDEIKKLDRKQREIDEAMDNIIAIQERQYEMQEKDDAYQELLHDNEKERDRDSKKIDFTDFDDDDDDNDDDNDNSEDNANGERDFKGMLSGDDSNNRLMDRINNELAFRTGGHSKQISKAYTENEDDKYASTRIPNKKRVPRNDFSSKRLGQRKYI
jgi:hypothetical protein